MSNYAPGAPLEIWAVQDIDTGTKLTVMAMWSWADHDDQREIKTTTVYAKMREGMTPTESLIAKVVEQTGAKSRAIREHFTKAKAAGYATIKGLAVTLHWPPISETRRYSVKKLRQSVENRRCSVNAVASENDAVASENDAVASENDAVASPQLNPPTPQPPNPPPEGSTLALPGFVDTTAESPHVTSDDELIAQFWAEYNAVRADAWSRWRPNHRVHVLELDAKKRKKLLGLCRDNAPKGAGTAELLDVARKVVKVARRELDRDRGRVFDSGWDSMRRLADYWLRKEHFDRMASEPEPHSNVTEVRVDLPIEAYDEIAMLGLLDDGGRP